MPHLIVLLETPGAELFESILCEEDLNVWGRLYASTYHWKSVRGSPDTARSKVFIVVSVVISRAAGTD